MGIVNLTAVSYRSPAFHRLVEERSFVLLPGKASGLCVPVQALAGIKVLQYSFNQRINQSILMLKAGISQARLSRHESIRLDSQTTIGIDL